MTAQNIFKPFRFLNFLTENDIALVLLNQIWYTSADPSENFFNFFEKLWRKSRFSASVDGGTNTLHKLNQLRDFQYVPDLISGDFDSVKPELLSFYKSRGTEVIRTPDQDDTDFTKALKILSQKYDEDNELHSIKNILCLVGKSDRVDHVMSNFNTLFTSKLLFPSPVNVCLLSQDSCSFLLSAGTTCIDANTLEFVKPDWCSLVPLQYPAVVTTTGLKRNFSNELLKFGTFSNTQYELDHNEEFAVETNNPLIVILPTKFF